MFIVPRSNIPNGISIFPKKKDLTMALLKLCFKDQKTLNNYLKVNPLKRV